MVLFRFPQERQHVETSCGEGHVTCRESERMASKQQPLLDKMDHSPPDIYINSSYDEEIKKWKVQVDSSLFKLYLQKQNISKIVLNKRGESAACEAVFTQCSELHANVSMLQ